MSDRALINRTKRSLATMKRKLQALSCDWEDLDQYVSGELERVVDQSDAIVAELDEAYPSRGTSRRQP